MSRSTGEMLRSFPLFTGFDPADLDRIAAAAARRRLEPGELLFAESDECNEAFVILEGELEILKRSGTRDVLLAVRGPGDVVGEMALLENRPRSAAARARGEVLLLVVPREVLDQVISTSAVAARALSGALLTRWRETESRLRQREQLVQLGTLAAGLAHELNNPAAAAGRAAAGFREAAERLARASAALGRSANPDAAEQAARRLASADALRLSSSERAAREEDLLPRLRHLGVERPGTVAGSLAELDPAEVDPMLDELAGWENRPAAAAAVAAAVARREVASLASMAGDALERISSIVGAVKRYAFTGRGPRQEVDLAQMLDDTLVLLAHKLKGIEVVREYDAVPAFPAFGSELNQVWANLVDNAVDAVREAGRDPGRIVLRTRVEDGEAVVEVEDDGTGIPEDVLPRVFDAFYTTKGPGAGTGLGLEISYGIVVHRHGGDISIDTEPGRTRVIVRLPLSDAP